MMTATDNQPAAAPQQLELPAEFTFSQSSLQAYEDCPRRFWLAHVQQLPWPAVEASPIQEHERLMRLGNHFHQLVERSENGIEEELLAAGLTPPLSDWFTAYRAHRPIDLPANALEIERILTIPFGLENETKPGSQAYRLAAKYDLIAADSERVIIIDWKTTRKRTDPALLRQRLQTAVYLYVMVEAAPALGWGQIEPEQIEMRYWFTAAPAHPVTFRYSRAEHATNHARLQRLLTNILSGQNQHDFPKVPDTPVNRRRFCNFCVYRSRCGRGVQAGSVDELPDLDDILGIDSGRDLGDDLEFTLEGMEELSF